MSDKKILRSVRLGGRLYRTDSKQDVEDLDKNLTPDQVKRLQKKDPPVLSDGFKGTEREEGEPLATAGEPGPARAQGVTKDKKGEVKTRVDAGAGNAGAATDVPGGETRAPAPSSQPGPTGTAPNPFAKTKDAPKSESKSEDKKD